MGVAHSTQSYPSPPVKEDGQLDVQQIAELLKDTVIFSQCRTENLLEVAKVARVSQYKKGEIIAHQGMPTSKLFVILEGDVVRSRMEPDGKIHDVDTTQYGRGIGTLHIVRQDPVYATAMARTDLKVMEIDAETLRKVYTANFSLAEDMMASLAAEVRKQSKELRTALFFMKETHYAFTATSLAATIESFYRSAVNSILTSVLLGAKQPLFAKMHIQVPTRIVYINGLKGMRRYLDSTVNTADWKYPSLMRAAMAFTPGIVMTPFSGVLEALNCATNPEPLHVRMWRGFTFRCTREIIFGLGLNQMSDYFEERVPLADPTLRNTFGSLGAGVCSGYLSHVPHNLATLKIGNPTRRYGELFNELVTNNLPRVNESFAPDRKYAAAVGITLVAPKGLQYRTIQIVGTFILINGIIGWCKRAYPGLP